MNMHTTVRRFVLAISLLTSTAVSTGAQSASTQDTPICQMAVCYRSSQFYLTNYKRLRFFPRDIFISGVNFNHPIDCVAQPGPILFALRANALNYSVSPLAWFNQQYVAAQLSHALMPIFTTISASKSSLGACYGLNFEPVKLTTGVEITPGTTIAELFTLCDVTGIQAMSEERDADMLVLANILSMLNSSCQ